MAHIIVKNGAVALQGGRVVTSAGGAPCCCDGGPGGDCDNGCGIRCNGPDCQILTTSLDIGCVVVDFGAVDSINVCPDTNTLFENVVEIYAFPTTVNVPRVLGVDFSVDFPILARTYTRRVSTGVIVTESIQVATSATVSLQVKHCSTSSSSVACPMADDITVSSQFGALGLVFSSVEALNFGNPHDNTITLGCGESENQTVLGSAVVEESASCDTPPTNYYARICGGTDTITVDITQRPASDTRFNISYQGSIYVLTSDVSDEVPVAVSWTSAACEEWPLAQLCGGASQITYDPALRPPDGVTALFFGSQYEPVAGFASSTPIPVTWTTDACPGPSGPCADLLPNDPLCALAIYRDCPQCVGFDIGDPQPEPTVEQQGGTIPGLGDMVAEAIRTVTFNTLLPCGACERRKEVLNRFGQRAGAAIIKRLGW